MTCRWVCAVQVITLLKDPKADLSDLVGSEFEKVGKTVWYVATGWQPLTLHCLLAWPRHWIMSRVPRQGRDRSMFRQPPV